MKSFGSINISNSYIENIINNYSVAETKEEKKSNEEEAEGANHSEVVEVQPVPTKEPVVVQCDVNKDYANSKLVPLLTYPEQANYLIGWMHVNIERQPKISERIRIIKALDSRYYFKSKVGYKDYIGEFGGDFTASWYSRLMKREIPSDELDVILESLDSSIFPIKK